LRSHDGRELDAVSNVDVAMNRPEPRPQIIGRHRVSGDGLATDEWGAHGDECARRDRQPVEREIIAKSGRFSRSGFTLGEQGKPEN
jgi:hypothetical protein